ncbi:uncharacterized protein LY79DRAFT_564960 [Colletotrichum navitas]|uniref:Uncharacterized protein n=1 Tax=Colletotrichum navitas TaxID=681940 RepID=A0AAD8V0Z4_9PEZI|nr:uncharacterized protein LY79DRAFT_564960 [Colletotrichum navitas]KAK1579172.1 hypothetical protein LY79DRAFT_564960 [Colletotrichum navitas]
MRKQLQQIDDEGVLHAKESEGPRKGLDRWLLLIPLTRADTPACSFCRLRVTPCINCACGLDFFARDGANDPPPSPAPLNRKRCPSRGQAMQRARSSNSQPLVCAGTANQTSAITSLGAVHGRGRCKKANEPGVSQTADKPTRRQTQGRGAALPTSSSSSP